MSYKFRQ